MEIKPVKQKKKPGYPTIKTFIDNPELLAKNVPFAWIRNQYAATTLATFILCGAGNQTIAQKVKPSIVAVRKDIKNNKPAAIQSVKHDPFKIAQIFSHGSGTGGIGCIVSSPPVFISEDEARKIIFTALKEENIEFSTTNTPVLKFSFFPIDYDYSKKGNHKNVKKETIEIKTDGYNAKNNLVIEYVSYNVYNKFKTDYMDEYSSVQVISTKVVAERIRNELIAQNKFNAVVFYDPIAYEERREVDMLSLLDKNPPHVDLPHPSRDQLKEQVKDFIEWIKKEGIIKN